MKAGRRRPVIGQKISNWDTTENDDPSIARRDLFEAMKQVAETGHGPQEQIPSMGCSIKWRH